MAISKYSWSLSDYAQTLVKPKRIYLEDSTVYEKLVFLRNIHRL